MTDCYWPVRMAPVEISVWNLETGDHRAMRAHKGMVNAIAFAPGHDDLCH